MSLQTLTHKDIKITAIKKADEFTGYQIFLSIKQQDFQFSIGYTTDFIPLGVKHVFQERSICHLCDQTILPVPVGQQICPTLMRQSLQLLNLLKKDLQ